MLPIPRRLGTVLIVMAVIVMPICYWATGVTLDREAACGGNLACLADAAFWRQLAIGGFVTGLFVGATGVIIDRLPRRK